MLVELGAMRKILKCIEVENDLLRELLEIFDLPELLAVCECVDAFDDVPQAPDKEAPAVRLKREVPLALRRRLRNFTDPVSDSQDIFQRNLNLLATALGLNRTERLLVHFGLLLTQIGWLYQLGVTLGNASNHAHINKLALILRVPVGEIRAALAPDSVLVRSGLLRVKGQNNACMDLTDRLELLHGLMDALLVEHGDALGVFQHYFRRAGKAELAEEDFAGQAEDYLLMHDYLCAMDADAQLGINFLIYGNPGVGKTQLVRLLAQSLDRPLYEIATVDENNETLDGKQRLRAYTLSQRVLTQNPGALVLFDEAEDVFGGARSLFSVFDLKPGEQTKAAINCLLEENPVPTFWLTNSVESVDPAYLRRFQYIVELRAGTRATRGRNFAKHLHGIPVSPACIEALAEQEALTPAVVANAAAVLRQLKITDPMRADATLRRIVEHTIEAMKLPHKPITVESLHVGYAPEYSNPDTDLAALVSGLHRNPHARLCLYGPPGTGKTAFGHYLAEQLDKPLFVKRASDLLSMWVGMSEQNIAAMFRNAERESAVLLLDEADSFLRERSGAHASWEVTQVNEVLTQMEAFQGIFIASTNLMDTLDAACLRRFDFKIRFNYLNPPQARELFASVLGDQSGGSVNRDIAKRLNQLDKLAPGDYTVVVRKARVFGAALDAERLIRGLEDECRMKERGSGKPVGFTARLN